MKKLNLKEFQNNLASPAIREMVSLIYKKKKLHYDILFAYGMSFRTHNRKKARTDREIKYLIKIGFLRYNPKTKTLTFNKEFFPKSQL